MEDKEILDLVIGGTAVKDMGSRQFMSWLTEKINGMQMGGGTAAELTMAIQNPPFGRFMPDMDKINLIRKLLLINIPVP